MKTFKEFVAEATDVSHHIKAAEAHRDAANKHKSGTFEHHDLMAKHHSEMEQHQRKSAKATRAKEAKSRLIKNAAYEGDRALAHRNEANRIKREANK